LAADEVVFSGSAPSAGPSQAHRYLPDKVPANRRDCEFSDENRRLRRQLACALG